MDAFWIIAAAMILVLLTLMVRIMVTRRSYRNSEIVFRRNTVGKSYFDRNKNCYAYTKQLLEQQAGGGRVFTGLCIPQEGAAVELDLLMVHTTGIYLFEIKDYGGALNGEAESKFWTLAFQNGRTENLYNPIWQGRSRISALEELLPETAAGLFFLYIVFGQRCVLQEVPQPDKNTAVVGRADLSALLENDFGERPGALSQEQMDAACEKLAAYAGKK
ncbi:MAG: nuclease-related domain-containing protein [Eubacteriales bacterium]